MKKKLRHLVSRYRKKSRRAIVGTHYTYSSQDSSTTTKRSKKKGRFLDRFMGGKFADVNWKKATIYGAFAFVLLAGSLFLWYSKDLPNPYKLKDRPVAQSTKIVDRNGNMLYQIHGEENRTLVAFEDIPDTVKQATVALEDKDFYIHSGFNFKGIARAFVYDIFHREAGQGGSTITQQFVKNAVLTNEKSISRKIKELILSLELEQIYSKNEILSMYLNEIPYGNNSYGIQLAARTYFDKDAKDLTLAESALLASLPQAPTYYNPYGSNTDMLMGRKDFALDQMVSLEMITREEAEAAKAEVIKFSEQDQGILAPHFVMYVREKLAEQFGDQRLESEGFTVTTTLDLEKQKVAEQAIADNVASIKARGASNASLVSLDPKTGQILAMVGSVDYFDKENDGNVNVAVRLRQPGSSIKPIVYTLAFERGYSPGTMLMDVPINFGQGYRPTNYDLKYRGPVTMRRALGNSLNIPAVETLALVGVKDATDFAQKLGATSLNDPDRYGLSLVLGGGEVQLLGLASAYGTLANKGTYQQPLSILKITDGSGETVYEYKGEEHKGEKVLSESVAYMTSNVLSDDAARADIFGFGSILTLYGRPVAAKTGTTNEARDGWTLGYTPSLVTGVWVGNNDNTPMGATSGSATAAPIWNQYMRRVLANTPVEQFVNPGGVETVTVDALTGKLPLENIPESLKDQLPTRQEIFLTGHTPTEADDVHKILTIIKPETPEQTTFKLASESCPANMIEQKVFFDFHAINPSWTEWEKGVVGWAEKAGYNNIPTEEENCDQLVKENQPTIEILSPADNSMLESPINVMINYRAPKEIDKVEYFLDEQKIGEKINDGTVNNYNLVDLVLPETIKGYATIKVILTDKLGLTATDSVPIMLK